MLVENRVSGAFGRTEEPFRLYPAVPAKALEPGLAGRLRMVDGHFLYRRAERGELSMRAGAYHPRFGVTEPSHRLVLRLQDARSHSRFTWI